MFRENPTLGFCCYRFDVHATKNVKVIKIFPNLRCYGELATLRGHSHKNYYFHHESKLQYTYFQKIKLYF